MTKIAIFASGSGTNAENIGIHFFNSQIASVHLVLSNKNDAYVHERAKALNIPSLSFTYNDFYELHNNKIISTLKKYDINFIVLAGFLLKVPSSIIEMYPNKILNIHPALLPKYGGKGMYGENVHKAIIQAREKESGITIHIVDEHYDNGKILYQSKCEIEDTDTPEILAAKIHELEKAYPQVIEKYIKTIKV